MGLLSANCENYMVLTNTICIVYMNQDGLSGLFGILVSYFINGKAVSSGMGG